MTKNLPTPGMKNTEPRAVSMLNSPVFGYCIDSGGDGWFIKDVEEEDPRVTVVVLFYEPDIPVRQPPPPVSHFILFFSELRHNQQTFE
jgi:hypothetical protein